ncbi:hypothetical protein RhiJN_19987 [Ceratobasidium sp. AG-Ba]|nr:hypothetical protein RhiJN_19987 [Ceratobasidium sp. AG-Ba]
MAPKPSARKGKSADKVAANTSNPDIDPDIESDAVNGTNRNFSGSSKHVPKESNRKRDQREHDYELATQHAEKKQRASDRRQERLAEQDEEMLVQQDEETEREAQLRRFAANQQARNDKLSAQPVTARTPGASGSGSVSNSNSNSAPTASASHAQATGGQGHLASNPPLIPVPDSMAVVTMSGIRKDMGLVDSPATIRDFICLAALDLGVLWKRQNKTQLGNLYSLSLERIPELQRFENNWAAEYITHNIFNHRRTYANKKQNKLIKASNGADDEDDNDAGGGGDDGDSHKEEGNGEGLDGSDDKRSDDAEHPNSRPTTPR